MSTTNMKKITSFIAENTGQIEASITMEITALANQLKADGKPIIGMSAGEPDADTPDHIKQAAIQAINDGKTKYTAVAGLLALREAIAAKIKEDHNLVYDPSQIVVSCGAKHTIFNLLQAILNPGDEVIIPTPYWVSYPDQVRILGGTPVFVETTDAAEFKLSAAQLDAAITPKTKVVILNTPSNPTGMLYTKSELQALAEVIVKHQVLVISDEIYAKLVYDGQQHVSIASLGDDIQRLTLFVDGLSKSFSMTGWRIGYCAVPKEIATVVGRIQSHSTSNPNTPAQWASIAALTGPETAIDEMRASFVERRNVMVERLNAIPGISCLTPHGAFYAFPNISGVFGKISSSGPITDSVLFCKYFLKEKLVACVPGSGFGAEGYIRLSYATSMDAIQTALDKLEAWVNTLS
jgi:aspartate aminotransferase